MRSNISRTISFGIIAAKRCSVALGRLFRSVHSATTRHGYNNGYDLSVADEILAVFAGVTLYLSQTEWLQDPAYKYIIGIIVAAVAVTIVGVILAINTRHFWPRTACYGATLLVAYSGVELISWASAHDLDQGPIRALPLGVIVWISIRELSVFLMNGLRRESPNSP